MSTLHDLESRLGELAEASEPPEPEELAETMSAGVAALREESDSARPADEDGEPGGVVYLVRDIPTVVVPDIHARRELIIALMNLSLRSWGVELRLLEALAEAQAQIVFVGDYVHAEARAIQRWAQAFEEYQGGFKRHEAMDQEMVESLGVLQMVASLKDSFPLMVHGLKGNHENIANEHGEGNYPFRKFVLEGSMVAEYMERFYPGSGFSSVYQFEKNLPLLAVGNRFLVSHAEPLRAFSPEEVINYRGNEEVVAGLTWTANDEAARGSVQEMLHTFLGPQIGMNAYYFGGHRPIESRYSLRAQGAYVQLHNPERFIAAILPASGEIDLERDVEELPQPGSAG
ncbi:MAG: metallophosphoesterase [Spirochaetaceae bacterium]